MRAMSRNKLVWLILILAGIISILAGFVIPAKEQGQSFWWSHIWAVFALIGFAGCLILILAVKWLGRFWLQRKEKYYD
jgi:hypothetical protein